MRQIILVIIFNFFIISCNASFTIVPGSEDANSSSSIRSEQSDRPRGLKINDFEKQVHQLVNEHRAKIGLNTLKWHTQATIESQDHSQDMASFRVPFGHIGYELRIDRIKAKDSDQIIASGENVAQNSTAQRAFNAWLRSPGHRKNIEGNFTHSGVGAVKSSNGSWYFTQIFLRK